MLSDVIRSPVFHVARIIDRDSWLQNEGLECYNFGMRKLLLILLLLFPVHGAWGKTQLSCNYKNETVDIETLFVIDERKNIIINAQGVKYSNVFIEQNAFHFSLPEEYFVSSTIKEYSYYINRITGHSDLIGKFKDGHTIIIDGLCIKTSSKKKF